MINVLKRLAELDAMNPNVQTEGSKHASRPGTEKRPGSADQAQKTLDRKKEVKAAAEKRRNEKGVEEGFDVKDSSGKVVHTAFSQSEAQKKADALSKSGNKHSVKYSRTSHPKADSKDVSESLSECGMMGDSMPGRSHTPASINMSADSGEELTGMLRDIMKLAGVASDATQHTDTSADIDVLSPTPTVGIATSDGEDMRAMIDKLNPASDEEPKGLEYDGSGEDSDSEESSDDEEETDESYDNSPASTSPKQGYNADARAYHPNSPGAAAGRGQMANPHGVPTMEEISAKLFSEYQSFLNERN